MTKTPLKEKNSTKLMLFKTPIEELESLWLGKQRSLPQLLETKKSAFISIESLLKNKSPTTL